MKRYDLMKILTNLNGAKLMYGAGDQTLPMTLRVVLVEALLGCDESRMSGKEKLERFNLADRVNQEVVVEFSPDEDALIRKSLDQWAPSAVYGRALQMLNGPGVPVAEVVPDEGETDAA